jgi:hypothetical protein
MTSGVDDMKSIYLFFSLLAMFGTIWAAPALSNETVLTSQQRLAVRTVIAEFLLLKGDTLALPPSPIGNNPPGEDEGSGDGSTGGNGGNSGAGDKEILIGNPDAPLFSLTKISLAGLELAAGAEEWSCLKDNQAELTWEMKTKSGDLHDQDDSFTWYNTDQTTNGGSEGFADNSGATCSGYVAGDPSTYCNTQAYVARVNGDGWCGYYDWRVPTIEELEKIVSLNTAAPTLYAGLLPKGSGKAAWSATPSPNYPGFAWHIYLNDGYAHGNDRSGNLPVLLVRDARPSLTGLLNR